MDKEARNLLLIIGAIIGLFVLIFAGSYFLTTNKKVDTLTGMHAKNLAGEGGENNYIYNKFSFININGLWYTQVQSGSNLFDVPLHYGPRDLEEIPVIGELDKEFYGKDLYVTFNPVDKNLQYIALASAELSVNLAKAFGIIPTAACDRNETETCKTRPIITCENNEPTMYIKQGEKAKITLKGQCATIEGKDMEIVQAADKFLLKMYGVMP